MFLCVCVCVSEDDEVLDVEGVLDNTIVETTWKRRTHPKQILPHVIHSLKAERRIMVCV